MSTENESELTPTENLVLEVLIARYRLGENIWTFYKNSTVTRALNSLEAQGVVHLMHPIVENTTRAYLTEAAKEAYISDNYVPPILRNNN